MTSGIIVSPAGEPGRLTWRTRNPGAPPDLRYEGDKVTYEDLAALEPPAAVEAVHFRTVLGNFCSGVTIVAAVQGDVPVGLTCQSFFSLSIAPPLVAFSPSKVSTTYPNVRTAGRFAINVLAEGQDGLAMQFARSGTDKWRGVPWRPGLAGVPLIDGALATIECDLVAEHDAGDHYLVVGRVLRIDHDDALRPLLFFRSAFRALTVE